MHVRISETQATVAVAGDLDVATAPILREQLLALVAEGAQRLIVDLRRVTFIESVALGVIIGARRRLGSADKGLCVVVDPSQTTIRKVFSVTGLDDVFPIHPTLEAAEEDGADDPSAA